MKSEGPYRTGDATCIVFRVGVGEAENFDSERDALNASRLANTAYAEGRNAMEKEFRELLDLANGMFDRIIEWRSCAKAVKDFDDWKKSRGIE